MGQRGLRRLRIIWAALAFASGGIFAGYFFHWRALLFLIDTGARLGELSSLTIESIKETPWGYVAEIHGKTGTKHVPLSYETVSYKTVQRIIVGQEVLML